MIGRPDREDLTRQRDAEALARAALREALAGLSDSARHAARSLFSPRNTVDLAELYGFVDQVRRAEEAHDLTLLDLATAAGDDA